MALAQTSGSKKIPPPLIPMSKVRQKKNIEEREPAGTRRRARAKSVDRSNSDDEFQEAAAQKNPMEAMLSYMKEVVKREENREQLRLEQELARVRREQERESEREEKQEEKEKLRQEERDKKDQQFHELLTLMWQQNKLQEQKLESQKEEQERRHQELLRAEQERIKIEQDKLRLEREKQEQARLAEGRRVAREKAEARKTTILRTMTPLTTDTSVEAYLETFEMQVKELKIESGDWMSTLRPLLTGKAKSACTMVADKDINNYQEVKKQILAAYGVTAQSCGARYMEAEKQAGQSFIAYMNNLQRLLKTFTEHCETAQDMRNAIVIERFYQCLPPHVAAHLRNLHITKPEEVATVTDSYYINKRMDPESLKHYRRPYGGNKPFNKPTWQRQDTHQPNSQPHKEEQTPAPEKKIEKPNVPRDPSIRKCFKCGEPGHIAARCPTKITDECQLSDSRRDKRPLEVHGLICGQFYQGLKIDGGSDVTLVHPTAVPRENYTGKTIEVEFGNRGKETYPTAKVQIQVGKQLFEGEVVVSKHLNRAALLGTDIESIYNVNKRLQDLWNEQLFEEMDKRNIICPLRSDEVLTRYQKKKLEKELAEAEEKTKASKATPKAVGLDEGEPVTIREVAEELTQEEENISSTVQDQLNPDESVIEEFSTPEEEGDPHSSSAAQDQVDLDKSTKEDSFMPEERDTNTMDLLQVDDSLIQPGNEKGPRKSRSSKRQKRRENWMIAETTGVLDNITTEKLKELQREDPGLQIPLIRATDETDPVFAEQDGLLYHKSTNRIGEPILQLVIPEKLVENILSLAHSSLLAGHTGRRRTQWRILQNFWWPRLNRDILQYCRSCSTCQKEGAPKRRAMLQPLPAVDQPFKRIAIDIVGPLPRTKQGFKYILTVIDHSTRFPLAVPLKETSAKTVAEALQNHVFCMFGLPEELISDQGTNFTSEVMAALLDSLDVTHIKTTPYHPETNGMLERFHRSLKQSLRKSIPEKQDWDKYLYTALFTARDSPCSATGFSPLELLLGPGTRGPLSLLYEKLTGSRHFPRRALEFAEDFRTRLMACREAAHEADQKAKLAAKKYADRKAIERDIPEGSLVLALIPTAKEKLETPWRGPYKILKKLSPTSYLIEVPEARKKQRQIHVNSLKEWTQPKTQVLEASLILPDEEEDIQQAEISVQPLEIELGKMPNISEQLQPNQRKDIENLVKSFKDVLDATPGSTTLEYHSIKTPNAVPIHQHPRRIPQPWMAGVRKEVEELLKLDIIEPSDAPWASPIVTIKKKDGTVRICVDYRKLNMATTDDPYPMPRIDTLLDNIGNAAFITTLDLSKGYYQVPVNTEDIDKTTFTSPLGKFRFKVMPFGLKNAPSTFQRLMDRILSGTHEYAAAYLDDIVVFSTTWNDHINHLTEIFNRLRTAGLTAKPSKCNFGMATCSYLGHVIGLGNIKPDEAKIHAIKNFIRPLTKKDVRSYLGLVGYYRKFIPNFASLSACLSDLTSKDQPQKVKWTQAHQDAFEHLKEFLIRKPIRKCPDYSKRFYLQTDASERGVGGVLSQKDEEGFDHPIAYFSRKLLPRETRYSATEKELLAIVNSLKHFDVYLLGQEFTIMTDHSALQFLNRMHNSNHRLTRWALSLQPYSFTVVHRAGVSNGNADGLSRQAWEEDKKDIGLRPGEVERGVGNSHSQVINTEQC